MHMGQRPGRSAQNFRLQGTQPERALPPRRLSATRNDFAELTSIDSVVWCALVNAAPSSDTDNASSSLCYGLGRLQSCSLLSILPTPLFAQREGHEWRPLQMHINLPGKCTGFILAVCWRDQGWGNQKGQFGLNKQPLTPGYAPQTQASTWEYVACDFKVEHQWSASHQLPLSYIVGGGGGHALHIDQLRVLAFHRELPARGVVWHWMLLFKKVSEPHAEDGETQSDHRPERESKQSANVDTQCDDLGSFRSLIKLISLRLPNEVQLEVVEFLEGPKYASVSQYAKHLIPSNDHQSLFELDSAKLFSRL